jgi:hypothetical protein
VASAAGSSAVIDDQASLDKPLMTLSSPCAAYALIATIEVGRRPEG